MFGYASELGKCEPACTTQKKFDTPCVFSTWILLILSVFGGIAAFAVICTNTFVVRQKEP
jgi:hypothetical protein